MHIAYDGQLGISMYCNNVQLHEQVSEACEKTWFGNITASIGGK